MGASKNRLSRMKQKFPMCAFCCGEGVTTSVEHMPSRVLFDLKQRPKGLEFPSCQSCQDSTRKNELVVAMLSRIYPDPRTTQARHEMREILRSVRTNFPGLLEAMRVDQVGVLSRLGDKAFKLPEWNFLSTGGAQVQGAINGFGLKLAKALHLELTGRIVPRGAGIFVEQFSNFNALTEAMPHDLMDAIGNEKTLQMGKQNAWDTFSYQSANVVDGAQTVHFAYFRQSFSLLMCVYPDPAEIPDEGRELMTFT